MTQSQNEEKKANRTLMLTMAVVVAAVAVIAVIGFVFMNRPDSYIEGQVEGTNVRISGKLPGRVHDLYVQEGDTVHAGDTLVHIHSSVAEAQLGQAEAMREVASSQNRKIDAGTRRQIISAAEDMLRQAEAGVTIAKKTYAEGVIPEQKRDEAKAAYDVAVGARDAAASQLSLARAGAQREDKESAEALVQAAGSGVDQVLAVLDDSYLTAPFDGTIDQIYPEEGELVSLGAPIMSLLRTDDRYVVFNVREELLDRLTMGKEIEVMIPALGKKKINVKIYYIRDMGSYATWRSTKSTGSYDSRTFQIKARPTEDVPGLRPGMSVVFEQPE